jgi:probable rRNA maturation factor
MAVEITLRPGFTRDLTRGLRPHVRSVAQRTLSHLGVRGRTLSVLITSDAEMRSLNLEWRKLDRTTDVLSFDGDGEVLGDVVISLEQAVRQSERLGVPLLEEIARLLVHGILHLLGHDHSDPLQRRAMSALTEKILERVL